ncbi:MAG TPA: hypothetical protein VHC21_03060 [Candidatus Saccharimonadales bacterium]|nr:hypothetical protein [Candidatus Saccharimonadales bacterium]
MPNPEENSGTEAYNDQIPPLFGREQLPIPVIPFKEFQAAQHDPRVHQAIAEALAEGEKWEETDWGYQLKAEYREEAESPSLLKKGTTLLGDLGKTAINGDLGKMMCQAIGRIF